jgi:hypothetical protein
LEYVACALVRVRTIAVSNNGATCATWRHRRLSGLIGLSIPGMDDMYICTSQATVGDAEGL